MYFCIDNKIAKLADPSILDYFLGFLSFVFALMIPGLHHFVLGNTGRGLLYLFTFNELYLGWFLDMFEIHLLIKKSVQEYGHLHCWFCSCMFNVATFCRCCICRKLCCWWSESMRWRGCCDGNNDGSKDVKENSEDERTIER